VDIIIESAGSSDRGTSIRTSRGDRDAGKIFRNAVFLAFAAALAWGKVFISKELSKPYAKYPE
jgi:hypothetical protein